MMKKAGQLLFFLITVQFLSSCEKEIELSKPELLSRTAWKMNSMIFDPPKLDQQTNEYYSETYPRDFLECDLDNERVFNEDGTYYKDEGDQKCDLLGPQQTDIGTWHFGKDEKELILRPEGFDIGIFFTIVELTETTLSIKESGMSGGKEVSVTRTYEAVK
jgi:hypothetical protein